MIALITAVVVLVYAGIGPFALLWAANQFGADLPYDWRRFLASLIVLVLFTWGKSSTD